MIYKYLQFKLIVKRGEMNIEINDLPRRVKVFLSLLIILLLVGTSGYTLLMNVSLTEGFVLTLETISFLFHPEGGGLLKALSIFLSLFGAFLMWWILWWVFDLLLEGDFSKYLKIRSHLSKLRSMKNHYIIAGGGRVGQEVAKKLKEEKKEHIIIEKDDAAIERLRKAGFLAVKGDVSDEEVLKEHNIQKAKALVLTLPETEKNIIVALTAKEIRPDLHIYARADKPNCVSKLKKAGADFVIVPELAAAEKMFYEMSIRDKKQ